MTDNELRIRLATALGWRPLEVAGQWHITREYGGKSEFMPSWATSLDACMRDLLPACQEVGYREWSLTSSIEGEPLARLIKRRPGGGWWVQEARSAIVARALAEACLSCLEAGE